MAWDDFASTDLAADDRLSTTVGAWMVARDRLLSDIPIAVDYVDTTTTSATYVTMKTFPFRECDFCSGGFSLFHHPKSFVSAGIGTLRMKTGKNTGIEITVTNTSPLARLTAPLEVALVDANTTTTVTIEGKVTGGNTLHLENFGAMLWVADT